MGESPVAVIGDARRPSIETVGDHQPTIALALANEARDAHVALRARLGTYDRSTSYREAAVVLLNPGRHLRGMKATYLLRSIKSVGPVKAVRICRRARVSETARLRDLTERQRHAIIAELRRAAR